VTTVLVVDDDLQLLRALRIHLAAGGYKVHTAADGRTALLVAAEHEVDVVVLDLGLPDLDGADVITQLRRVGTVPIVVLSARHDSTDKVTALDRGADDYVTKPFGIDELMARLRAAVRRATVPVDDEPVEAGELVIDLGAKVVRRSGQEVHLTPTEWGILELLVRRRGRLVSRKELLEQSWGAVERKETSYLRVYLAQLRRKLEDDPAHPQHLITEAGMGYRFRT
jgi:two-component system, OmpR family, KDP operon response regulator KdpE